MKCGQFVPDHVRSPVLRYSHSDKAVQCHRCRQHKIGHQLIIVLILTDLRSYLHQGLQDAFRPAVHHPTLSRGCHVLLHHMYKRISNTAGHLMGRQCKRHFRIKNGEQGIIGIERIFLFGFMTRNDGSAVHFRSRGRQSEDSSKRNGICHRTSGKHQIPRIPIVQQSGRNQLRAIDDRSASYSQQIVHLLLFSKGNGFT